MKQTPLHDWHITAGANKAEFGGYEMPLWYPGGVKNEHLAVLTGAGLFDTSHMAVVMVSGKGARGLLQKCFTKDLDACDQRGRKNLQPGKCVYGAFLNEKGHVKDDAIVYMTGADTYMTVVNAGMGGAIASHLSAHAQGEAADILDCTDRVGKIDLQGPASARVLAAMLADPGSTFQNMPYFSFKGHFDNTARPEQAVLLKDQTPVLLSRTGYTGEFGFEIFLDPDRLAPLWRMLVDAGKEQGIAACGLAARDSLRGGAVLPLSHQDIGPWPFINHPWPFALPFKSDGTGFTKTFIGHEALSRAGDAAFTHAFAGYDPRKVSVADPARAFDTAGNPIGEVLTCVTDVAIGRHGDRIYSIASPDRPEGFKPRGLCCGFVKVRSRLAPGREIELRDNRRKIKVMIVEDIRPDQTARRPMREMA